MKRFPILWSRESRSAPCSSRRVRSGRPARPQPERLEARTVLSTTYTLPMLNHTLLNPARFSIYVDGFSTASGLSLQPNANTHTLTFQNAGTNVLSYQLGRGAGKYSRVAFSSSQSIDGARIYFFVVPHGQTPPSFPTNDPQPTNPPAYQYLTTYIELTNPTTGAPPTVDISTVDGFSFPATLKLNNKLGTTGQPLSSQYVNRATILREFTRFMISNASAGGANYLPLKLPRSSAAAHQSQGLLNPYLYLVEPIAGGSLPVNVSSPLNGVFDTALNTLFSSSGWSLKGSDGNIYTATAGTYQYASLTNPYTGTSLKLPGIQLTGGGNTFDVFNPVGVNTYVGTNGLPILATSVPGNLNEITLTNPPASSALALGTYIFGTGFNQSNGSASAYITSVSTSNNQEVVTLNQALAGPITNFQVAFSQVPYLQILQLTPGEMVFGNTGFFADATLQGYASTSTAGETLGNLENQIVSAFNRGVAVAPGALAPSTTGNTTQYWGTETNWYPTGQPQNLFSWFLHTATIHGTPIFLRPPGAVTDNQGHLMGMAYGFGYDENPGPVPPAPANQPEVPSKFDPVPAGTTRITITLDPWSKL